MRLPPVEAYAVLAGAHGHAHLGHGEPLLLVIAATAAMLDDAVLGLLVVIVGLAAWAIYLVAKDPKSVLRKSLARG